MCNSLLEHALSVVTTDSSSRLSRSKRCFISATHSCNSAAMNNHMRSCHSRVTGSYCVRDVDHASLTQDPWIKLTRNMKNSAGLLACSLFSDAFSVTQTIHGVEWRGGDDWWIGKYVEGNGHGLILRHYIRVTVWRLSFSFHEVRKMNE
jgi:hypothetical protein